MMRTGFSVLVALAAGLLWQGPASATVTIDLLWADGGTTLTINPNDLGNSGGAADCRGFATGAGQRCMLVLLTMDKNLSFGTTSVQFDTSDGLQAADAAVFQNLPPWGAGLTNPPTIDNFAGTVVDFGGASSTGGLAKGTYTIGTILWDTSAMTGPGPSLIASFLKSGLDTFLYLNGVEIPESDLQLNHAVLWVGDVPIPEPGTASLLGLGLVALSFAVRRRDRKR